MGARKLSVAYEACRVPQVMDNPLYDHGKHGALWVSAFETLAHPGTRVDLKKVLALIGERDLADSKLSRRARMRDRDKVISLNAAQRLYFHLYRGRNSFLPGNSLSVRVLVPNCLDPGIRLLDTAPLVFHAALEAHLLSKKKKRGAPTPQELIREILAYNALEEAFCRALGF